MPESNVSSRQDSLAALERRGDELEAFGNAERQAHQYIRDEGTDALVFELRQARTERRRMKIGTINVLVLLKHIDRLESELSGDPLRKP